MRSRTPTAIDAERATLGALMLDGSKMGAALEAVEARDFHAPHHRRLFELMRARVRREQGIDLISLIDAIVATGEVELFGGAAYVVTLPDFCPSVLALPSWLAIVRETAVRRRMLEHAEELIGVAESDEDPGPLVHALTSDLLALRGRRQEARSAADVVSELLDDLAAEQEGRRSPALSSGLDGLDDVLGGLRLGELTVLAARPSMGKTAVAMNIALALARAGSPVGIVSLEMRAKPLLRRLLPTLTGVPMDRVMRPRQLDQADWDALVAAREAVDALPLHICDEPGLSADQIAAQAQAWAAHGVEVLIIDHLSEMKHPKAERNDLAVGASAQMLKDAGARLGMHTILLQQLNRGVEQRANKRPMRSDLRDSGRIEELADNVIFVYRDHYYDEAADPFAMELIVAKCRMGRAETVQVEWQGRYQTVRESGPLD